MKNHIKAFAINKLLINLILKKNKLKNSNVAIIIQTIINIYLTGGDNIFIYSSKKTNDRLYMKVVMLAIIIFLLNKTNRPFHTQSAHHSLR